MTNLYENLLWLPNAPKDFTEQLAKASTGEDLRKLTNFSLDDNQLNKLANKLFSLQHIGADLTKLSSFGLGIVSNSTTKLITPSLVASALRFGVLLKIIETEFNQVAQEAFSEYSAFEGHKLDAVLLSIDYHGLPFTPSPGNTDMSDETLANCLSYVSSVASNIHSRTGALVILQNIAPPPEQYLGGLDRLLPGTLSWLISRLNNKLDSLVSSDLVLLDIAGLASTVGLANWHEPTLWNMAKLPFAQKYVPAYANQVCRIISALRGKSRRCLILDLDNVLWGGVIGDEGIHGILVGNGDATGEAHLDIQRVALGLRSNGVVLAVSSKNDDAIARQPFRYHPDMLLREEHIAVFQANWSDKASNIRAIADSLSLGLESLVFLDDNPAERMQVRMELPEVAVPELPADPALYGRTLLAAGYFEAVAFSTEDINRASYYQQNAQRAVLQNQVPDMDGYLRSLEMVIEFRPFDATGRSRIVQLINKSNQFNLTTKRYGEPEVRMLEKDVTVFTLQIRLTDIFGDNGMIGIVICHKAQVAWEIDTWLMSCRVLGRSVEEATLQHLLSCAKSASVLKLIGTYVPTERNVIVKDHYMKLGFTKVASKESGEEVWELEVDDSERKFPPMKVITLGNLMAE